MAKPLVRALESSVLGSLSGPPFRNAAARLAADGCSARAGGRVKSYRSWVALLAFCGIAAFAVALLFATLFAGAALAFTTVSNRENEAAEKQAQPQTTAPSGTAPSGREDPAPAAGTLKGATATFRGMVTDSHCMGRHVRYPDKSPVDCAKMCARSGSAYVLVDGDRKYTLQGADLALDKVAARRAVVTGKLDGDIVKVASVAAQ
jgi:hypothetical protein